MENIMNQALAMELQMSKMNSSLKVDEIMNSSNLLSLFLRGYRSRTDLAQVVCEAKESNDNLKQLEMIRTLILQNKIDEASLIVETIETNDDYEASEILLEKCRINLFRKNLNEVVKITHEVKKLKGVSPVTLLTLLQIRGDALIQMNQISEAIDSLKMAITLADIYPLSSSAFSSYGFLVMAYIRNNELDQAKSYLDRLFLKLESCDQEEMWLGRLLIYLRTEFHYYLKIEKSTAKEKLLEAMSIARWVEDQLTINKCLNDFKSLDDITQYKKEVVISFKSWDLLPDLRIILFHTPKKIVRLENSPSSLKILVLLSKGSVHIADFFKEIWNLEYDADKHYQHVKATISKLRKKLPSGVLKIEDNMIYLS